MMPCVFISYSRADENFAHKLTRALVKLGLDVWIDLEDIPAGTRWSKAIQDGLDASDLMIVILSPESFSSPNVEDEWQYFLDQRKPVVPVLLRPTKIHYQLSRIQYVNFYKYEFEPAFAQLQHELARRGIIMSESPTLNVPMFAAASLVSIPAPLAFDPAAQTMRRLPPRPADPTQPSARRREGARFGLLVTVVALSLVASLAAALVLRPIFEPLPVVSTQPVVGAPTPMQVAFEPTSAPTTPPTSAPTAQPTRSLPLATVVNTGALSLRRGPSRMFRSQSIALQGTTLPVVGRDPLSQWYLVAAEDGSVLWMSTLYAVLAPDDADLPVYRSTSSLSVLAPASAFAQPDDGAQVVGSVAANIALPVVDHAADNDWYGVVLPTGEQAWLPADGVRVEG